MASACRPPQLSNDKIRRELGMAFLDRSVTLKDQVERMKLLGLLPGVKG